MLPAGSRSWCARQGIPWTACGGGQNPVLPLFFHRFLSFGVLKMAEKSTAPRQIWRGGSPAHRSIRTFTFFVAEGVPGGIHFLCLRVVLFLLRVAQIWQFPFTFLFKGFWAKWPLFVRVLTVH